MVFWVVFNVLICGCWLNGILVPYILDIFTRWVIKWATKKQSNWIQGKSNNFTLKTFKLHWKKDLKSKSFTSATFQQNFEGMKGLLSIVNGTAMYVVNFKPSSFLFVNWVNSYDQLEPVAKSVWGNLSSLLKKITLANWILTAKK